MAFSCFCIAFKYVLGGKIAAPKATHEKVETVNNNQKEKQCEHQQCCLGNNEALTLWKNTRKILQHVTECADTQAHTAIVRHAFCVEVGHTMVICTSSETDDARFYADIELDVLADY